MSRWRFLTNHALVVMHIYEHPRSTLREISYSVGITERAALSIVRQLEQDGIVSSTKEGRQKHYTVNVRAILKRRVLGPYDVELVVRFLKGLADQFRHDSEEEPPDDDGSDS